MSPLETHPSLDHDRYQVGRLLGTGQNGVVYEAWDRRRNAPVAVKLLKTPGADAIYLLKREFRLLAELGHPNLVNLYELVHAEGTWFIVMELVQGEDFFAWVRGTPADPFASEWFSNPTEDLALPTDTARSLPEASLPPDIERLTDAIAQVVRGLAALHDHGRLHCDVKPANVLVRPDGRAVIVDFGLVWDVEGAHSEVSRLGEVMGTAAFMSPEQARGEAPTPASDLYAVGVMLFQGLTGRLPFEGPVMDMTHAKQQSPPPRPSDLLEGVPEALDDLARDLLSPDSASRPSAGEVLTRLGRPAPGGAMIGRPRFVGREQEMEHIDALWARARTQHGVLALVHGTAGIGRSRFVQQVASRLRRRDRPLVLWGRCLERESVPFKAFDQLVDALRRRLERLDEATLDEVLPSDMGALVRAFPALGVFGDGPTETLELGDISDSRNRAFRAFRQLLANLARHRPLLIAIDDAHWADIDSVRLLVNLLRDLRGQRVLWILTYRDEEALGSDLLTQLHDGTLLHGLEHADIALLPLSSTDAEVMAHGLVGQARDDASRMAADIALESGGNPYFLTELARHALFVTPAGAMPEDERRRSLDDLIASRLDALPEPARRLARAVALTNRPLPLRVLARAADAEQDARGALVALDNLHLVRASTGPLGHLVEPYHERVASSIAEGLTPDARGALHLRIARAMEQYGWNEPESLFTHMLHGGDQRRAGELAARAARNAADALAFERSAEYYQTALALGEWPPDERAELQVALGEVLIYAGRGREAAQAFLKAAPEVAAPRALVLRRRAGEQLLVSGHVDEGLALFAEVLEAVHLTLAPSYGWARFGIARNRLLTWMIGVDQPSRPASDAPTEVLQRIDAAWFLSIGLMLVEPLQGRYFHEWNLRLSLRCREPLRMLRALSLELVSAAMDPAPRSAASFERTRRRARELAAELGTPHARGLVALGEGLAHYVAASWDRAYQSFRVAEQTVAQGHGEAHFELAAAKLFAAKALAWRGRLREADEERALQLAEAEASGNRLIASNLRLDIFPLMLIALGRTEACRREIDHVLTQWQRPGIDYPRFFAMHGQVYLHLYDERFRDAWDLMAGAEQTLAASGLTRLPLNQATFSWLQGLAAVKGAARGDALLSRAATKIARALRASRLPVAHAHAAVVEAGMARLHGDQEAAISRLQEARDAYDALGMALHANACLLRLGSEGGTTGQQGARDRARAWMLGEGVSDPGKVSRLLAPGFGELDPD